MSRKENLEAEFKKVYYGAKDENFQTAGERMTLDDKRKVLESLGRQELIDLFKEWKPRRYKSKRTSPPLDQRITLTATTMQRQKLESELRLLKQAGEKVSMAQYVRSHAAANPPDIQEWAQIAEQALNELDDTIAHKEELEQRRVDLATILENQDDDDFENLDVINEINDISRRLSRLLPVNTNRSHRLSGRMTMQEVQTVKWRAERLCLSVSDFLRMSVFSLRPNSAADQHLSIDAKRRFYVSIIDVATNGWGSPPEIYACSQCQEYLEEIRKLRRENEILKNFAK